MGWQRKFLANGQSAPTVYHKRDVELWYTVHDPTLNKGAAIVAGAKLLLYSFGTAELSTARMPNILHPTPPTPTPSTSAVNSNAFDKPKLRLAQ